MSPLGTSAPPDPAVVMASAGKGLVEELARSLEVAVSRPVKAGAADVVTVAGDELAAKIAGPAAAFCLEFGGVCKGRAAIVMGARLIAALVGLLKGLEGAELTAKIAAPPVDEDMEELGVTVAGALVGLAEHLGTTIGEAPGLGLGDALLVPEGDPGELLTLIGAGPYPVAGFELEIDELAKGPALILFPGSFSAMPAPGGEEQPVPQPVPAGGVLPEAPRSNVIAKLHPNIQRILRLKLPVSVVLAEKQMPVETVVKLGPGTIIEFSKSAEADLDLRVNDQRIGTGEVVIIGERFGIQLRTIEGLQQRIKKLGGARS